MNLGLKSFIASLLVFSSLLVGVSCFAEKAPDKGAEQPVQGVVQVKKELAGKVSPTDILYIVVRRAGETGGAPLAVLRVLGPKFPHQFEVGPTNVMMTGALFKGPFTITAKLSKRGDAMTAPGDLLGNSESKQKITNGTRNVQITLDKVAP